jgi:hypothetical protein
MHGKPLVEGAKEVLINKFDKLEKKSRNTEEL